VSAERAEPRWARRALIGLLLLTAVAYMWDLSASGYANSFYAAAVQAGTKSWKAFFFGSIDSSNFITVDKPPASLWVMELSGRIFGFSSWSMLVPQALEGVAAVALLHASVKRWFGAGAGLAAGALLAITPVAALMFRFNNPDSLLVCLLVAAAYCLTRALERAGTRWVLAAGTLVGLAFLAKMMQAFLVLPAFGLVYLVAAPTGLRRRVVQLCAGGVAIVLSAGWWVAIVALWPTGSRPFIDGSSNNSIINLILGYNGLGRLFGQSGPGGGGGAGANFSGPAGVLRLFDSLMGGQASWLLPASLLALAVGLWSSRRAVRTDRTRAAMILWGGWLLVSAVVFSFSSGIIHTYYTVALAPAIAALVAITGSVLWKQRHRLSARALMALGVALTAGWAYVLLHRTPSWEPWLTPLILASAAVGILWLLSAPALRLARSASVACATLAIVACVAGPVAYSAQTITTAHTGSIPSAGPASASGGGFGPGGGIPGGAGSRGGGFPGAGAGAGAGSGSGSAGRAGGLPGGGSASAGAAGSLPGAGSGSAGGSASAGAGSPPGAGSSSAAPPSGGAPAASSGAAGLFGSGGSLAGRSASTARAGASRGAGAGQGAGAGFGGGGGGGASVSRALVKALEADAGRYRWVAAVSGSQSAASIELASGGEPVMAIGGFSGQGGNLTLAEFEKYVQKGEIHYYLASSGGGGGGPAGGPGGRSSSTSSISSWVKAHYRAVTVGGQTLYDLTQPLG